MVRRIYPLIWLSMLFLLTACAAQEASYAPSSAPAEAPAYDRAAAPQSADDGAWAGEPVGGTATRLVIASARIEIVVQDTDAAAETITGLVQTSGGYVASTNLYKTSYNGNDMLRGTITLRVPAEELDSVIASLETIAVDVRSKTVDRQDVTDHYSDLQAQLRALEATETELLELLAEVRAKPQATADEIMSVYRSLTEIRTEIERLQGRRNLLDNQIRFSSLEISLIPDTGSLPVVEAGWRPAVEARAALRTLVAATQGLAKLIIWAVLFLLPLVILFLIPLGIAFWILRVLYRRFGKRKLPTDTPSVAGEA
jgi:hypothetical protein